jgi:protein-S-isoprenylcysteine O-methyltransferase Ste14
MTETKLADGGVADAVRSPTSLQRLLASPWFDRAVAIVAVIPFANSLRHELDHFGWNVAWFVLNCNFILLVATMLIRRSPTRVTPNPAYWLLAFVATYWIFIMGRVTTPGPTIAPMSVIYVLSFDSFVISCWARLSLGRNIGLVPAQRELVSHGAYRWMRHPIYTGIYLAYLATTLQGYSLRNAVIYAVGAALFVVKSFVEEGFLARDPAYVAYMAKVPWRWFPYIV